MYRYRTYNELPELNCIHNIKNIKLNEKYVNEKINNNHTNNKTGGRTSHKIHEFPFMSWFSLHFLGRIHYAVRIWSAFAKIDEKCILKRPTTAKMHLFFHPILIIILHTIKSHFSTLIHSPSLPNSLVAYVKYQKWIWFRCESISSMGEFFHPASPGYSFIKWDRIQLVF